MNVQYIAMISCQQNVNNMMVEMFAIPVIKPAALSLSGSAAASAISQYSLAVLLYVYICWRGLFKPTWGGQFF